MVGDDDVGSLCLQMLPAAHFKSKTQEVLHVTNQVADNPEGKKTAQGEYTLLFSRLLSEATYH